MSQWVRHFKDLLVFKAVATSSDPSNSSLMGNKLSKLNKNRTVSFRLLGKEFDFSSNFGKVVKLR